MSNYILDKAYKAETTGGISANRAVVQGDSAGGCKLPSAANEGAVLGIAAATALQNHSVAVRKAGIASAAAAGAISRGDAVCIADSYGRIKTAARASAASGIIGNNNAVRWSAAAPGITGNNIIVDIVVSGANTALAVSVTGNKITINSATNSGSSATTTAAEAIAAVSANSAASKIVRAANESTSSGSGVIADETIYLSGGELGSNIIGYAEESASAANDIIDIMLSI